MIINLRKLKLTLFLAILVTAIFSIISHSNAFAITVGQQLTAPENGWRRYDDLDINITCLGTGWSDYTGFSSKNGASTKTNSTPSASTIIQFNFIGNKIRTYGARYSGINTGNTIIIDGISYPMALWSQITSNYIGLSFEKTDLIFKEHYVQIV